MGGREDGRLFHGGGAMSDAPAIYDALAAVMVDVQAVAKNDRNTHQNFMFRGIDAVVNAVGPALRHHGVVVVPEVRDVHHDAVETSQGKPSTACRVTVAYHFFAPDGSSVTATVAGEAWDHGDKATPKAMSVAFRTALLQALTLPTDEPDPDSETYERGGAAPAQQPRSGGGNGGGRPCAVCGDDLAGASVAKVEGGYAHRDGCAQEAPA